MTVQLSSVRGSELHSPREDYVNESAGGPWASLGSDQSQKLLSSLLKAAREEERISFDEVPKEYTTPQKLIHALPQTCCDRKN